MEELNIGILGGTLTGNRGAEAMVQTIIQEFSSTTKTKVTFHVFTYYPKEDHLQNDNQNIVIHSATPISVVTRFLWESIKPWKNNFSFLDVVLDVAGVSFIDSRLKFLPYNCLSLLPFLRGNVPVIKCSQAMGPFNKSTNRILAKWFLGRCKLVVSRGKSTAKHISELSLPIETMEAPDLAFLLTPCPKNNIQESGDRSKIGIAPSSLLMQSDEHYVSRISDLIRSLINRNFQVEIICHSWRSGSSKARNNDLICAHKIIEELAELGRNIPVIGEGYNAAELKAHIGTYEFLVTSRFHGMIAALSMKTPIYVVGWSHKYMEVLIDFELSKYAIASDQWNNETSIEQMISAYNEREEITKKIITSLPVVESRATVPINRIKELINFE